MNIKLFELRDRGTFIPCIAIQPSPRNERERYLLERAGYGPEKTDHEQYVLFGRLGGGPLRYDPYDWPGPARTYHEAHNWLLNNWSKVKSGDVLDVQYILGETQEPKITEQQFTI